ncbi:helix-turn-helix transcriptional regulator [Methylomonas sp. MO1]|uniref:helix-turn-helix domain-containing protein n=1 Tax=unclassified Methylomonas TaxID=2608980 RepID=UPI0009DFBF3D|nr:MULTISPECIES: helix-turn-helix transcriptional regulator [unclassified Methylomonas]MDT4289574.1 helix-turn-helix transcriptional regulator [Methylomonas sp. MO1]
MRGWPQEQLTPACGMARSYLGGVEWGKRNIALLNICKLADALSVSPAEMLKSQKG